MIEHKNQVVFLLAKRVADTLAFPVLCRLVLTNF